MKLHFMSAVALVIILLTGCNPEEDTADDTVTAGLIDGRWTGLCVDNGDGTFDKKLNVYSGSSVTTTLGTYDDSSCSTPLVIINAIGSVTFGNAYIAVSGETVYDVDFSGLAITATPKDTFTAIQMNNDSYCGYTNWIVDIPQSIIGCDYSGDGVSDLESTMYDIVELTSNTEISFGGMTVLVADRPTGTSYTLSLQ